MRSNLMKRYLILTFILTFLLGTTPAFATYGVQTKTSGCIANQVLPDPACTPGAVLTTDTKVICVTGYTTKIRNVSTATKKKVFQEYGIPWSERSNYEIDHEISLEIGGSNDISNLFPESYLIKNGARVKDTFENYLHKQVCTGKLSITDAQHEISTDWLTYNTARLNPTKTPVVKTNPSTSAVTPSIPATSILQPNISNTSGQQNPTTVQSGFQFYTSSYGTTKYYYPASCSGWKSLSSKYIKGFDTLNDLLKSYPGRIKNPSC